MGERVGMGRQKVSTTNPSPPPPATYRAPPPPQTRFPLCPNRSPPLHVASQNRAPAARFLAGSSNPAHPRAPLNRAPPPAQPHLSAPQIGPLSPHMSPPACRQPKPSLSGSVFGGELESSPSLRAAQSHALTTSTSRYAASNRSPMLK